ncbi:hypothetical protein L226DRAFT_22082 [Lentinus tigrinus ALCF2SS1-7]|uniref:uncharacterized protein n=1 Tax=Lentinus tigrinus ALCF2SS1-7 TaxID=1328758 RepID=UPI0011661978|nr:hypothetical protein L226DRAFT_22082 [Lentinus tigrinus ALCF2SS1-7]
MSRSGLHWTSDTKPTGPSFGRTLAQVLEDGSNVTGAFSCMQTHVLAPNPGLQVDDIGTLGLPLSVREAAAFKACAEYAATANRDASANEKHCWEVEARKVHFGNNEWTTFIDATFRQVCDNFAICSKINKSRYEFRRLALYETGYSLLPPRRQRGDEGVFATVVVILPSKFSGGSVCVAHDNREETYDCSPGSLTNTTVLAWFDECTLEAQPLTGGFQLALHFDLIHTTETPQPSLSGQDCIVSRLRDIFSTWNSERGSSDTPKKIVCLLQDKHPGESLAHASLSGTDARSVLLLSNVGKLHGFRVGLATLICTERGLGELERGYYGDDDWIEGANDVSMVEVDDRDVAITRLVSLDGRLICASLEHDLKREAIPAHMLKLITAERPDKQMYAYVNSKHMSFKQVFRRTVAVVWPQWAEFELVHGPYGFLDACKRLRACNNTQPTAEDSELVEGILARTDESTNEAVMESVCRVALLWDDFPLWLRTVKACDAEQSISAMGEENIYRTVSVFGFQQVRECLQRMLQRDPSDVDALQFLEDFKEWASEQDAPEQSATMNHWIAAQRTKRIASLRGPIERDYEALVKLIIEHGDADELESQVVPYLISSGNKLVLAQCVNLLAGEGFTLKHLVDARARITGVLLATVHPNINFRPMLISEEAADNEDLLELLQLYMKGCMAMDRHDLLSLAWPRLRDVSGLSRFEISSHVGHTLFPLISHVAEVAPAAYRPETRVYRS